MPWWQVFVITLSHKPWGSCFLMDQIFLLAIFVEGDHYCQIIFNSEHSRRCLKFPTYDKWNWPHPWGPYLLMFQIHFSYICRKPPSDYFCHIVFCSDHWFQRRRILKFLTSVPATPPNGHVFWRIKFVLAILEAGHQVIISTIYFFNSYHWFQKRLLKFLLLR